MITLHNKMQQKFNVRESSREVTDTAPCLGVSVQFHFTTNITKRNMNCWPKLLEPGNFVIWWTNM